MKKLILALALLISIQLFSQETQYVAVKSGLPLREKQDLGSKALDKIPYGTKLKIVLASEEEEATAAEGLTGHWKKTSYNGKTGYVNDIYLFPSPPPKAGIQDMKGYILQITQPFGSKLVVKHGSMAHIEESGYEMRKQLYKNGAEIQELLGYEYASTTYFIPDFDLQKGFLLLRMIPEFKDVFASQDVFPRETKTFTRDGKSYTITVEKEDMGSDPAWITRIKVEYEDGASYEFEMYEENSQLIVTLSSGV